VPLDHRHACAHDPGELVHRDPAASAFDANVERRSYRRAGVAIPALSIAGAHSRFRKFATSNGPPFGPPKTYTVSTLAGSESTASSAADVIGTSRRERCVLVPRTLRTRLPLSMSRLSTAAHSDGRSPVAAAKRIAAAPRVSSSFVTASSSLGVKTRTARGEVAGSALQAPRGSGSCSRSEPPPRMSDEGQT
jgi:hypothetical protein